MLSFGQLFGSNFWSSFKSQPSESIEKLLKKDNCTIEELLDDSDLLQECKNANKNLIAFLTRDKLKQLINFITVMPEEDEHKRGHKYPFIASEMFSCDMSDVIDMFFKAPSEDIKQEQEEQPEEDEDATKIDSHYEKDANDDSGSDSDDDKIFYSNSNAESEENKEDDKHEEASEPSQQESTNEQDTANIEQVLEEKTNEAENPQSETLVNTVVSVEFDVEDKVEEQKLDSADSSVDQPKTEEPQEKLDQTDEKLADPNTSNETETKDTTTEVVNAIQEESKAETTEQLEEIKIPETITEAHTAASDQEIQIHSNNGLLDDDDTVISEATTEISTKDAKQKLINSNKYDLLDYLTKFIDTDNELNDVLAGYFSRLLNLLIQKKGDEVGKYFYSHEHLLYRFADHSYSKSLSEIIIKILDINIEKIDYDKEEITRIRKEFIKLLLVKLKHSPEEICYEYSLNIFQIFNELTYKKYYDMLIEQHILNTLGEILTQETPECSSNAAVRILNVLISNLRNHLSSTLLSEKKAPPASLNDSDDEQVVVFKESSESQESPNQLNTMISTHPLVEFLKSKIIDHLVDKLLVTPKESVLDLQYGTNQPILGKMRLSIVNLMESLVELEDQGIRAKIMETNFYSILFDLFLQYPFNTFLHLHVDNIFH